jgi:hypothetical protein
MLLTHGTVDADIGLMEKNVFHFITSQGSKSYNIKRIDRNTAFGSVRQAWLGVPALMT